MVFQRVLSGDDGPKPNKWLPEVHEKYESVDWCRPIIGALLANVHSDLLLQSFPRNSFAIDMYDGLFGDRYFLCDWLIQYDVYFGGILRSYVRFLRRSFQKQIPIVVTSHPMIG